MTRDAHAEIKLPSYWSVPTDSEMEPLFLKHVMLSFLLFSSGIVLGVVAFGFEMGFFKFKVKIWPNREKFKWTQMRTK